MLRSPQAFVVAHEYSSYDPTGTIKTIETAPDGKAVFWDVNMVSGPRKGGQKTYECP